MPESFRFPKERRLVRQNDFRDVYSKRCRVFDERLIVFCAANDLDFSRLGLSVSKKIGSAPTRNRWKRLVREAFRLQQFDVPTGFDFIVVPQRLETVPTFEEICDSVRRLFVWDAKKYRKRFCSDERSNPKPIDGD